MGKSATREVERSSYRGVLLSRASLPKVHQVRKCLAPGATAQGFCIVRRLRDVLDCGGKASASTPLSTQPTGYRNPTTPIARTRAGPIICRWVNPWGLQLTYSATSLWPSFLRSVLLAFRTWLASTRVASPLTLCRRSPDFPPVFRGRLQSRALPATPPQCRCFAGSSLWAMQRASIPLFVETNPISR